jgi:glycosyltransferase involved in cell wall biosynthesis
MHTGVVCSQFDSNRVSIVIPCLNEVDFIGPLLDALEHLEPLPDEVVIVDGGSTDGTLDVIRRCQLSQSRFPLRLIELPGASIPHVLNVGVSVATGEFIVRLDAHSKPSRDYIGHALRHLANPDVGVVGGVWKVAPSSPGDTAAAIARAVSHPLGAGDAAYRTTHGVSMPRDVDTVPFGCFRKALWAELGGFDTSLQSNEDYEFNYRVRRSRRRVVLEPAMHSVYYSRPTLRTLSRQYFRYGWWKAQMLRRGPMSIRWRQAASPSFIAVLLVLATGGFATPGVWVALAGVVAIYAAAVFGTATWICVREGGWRRWPALCAAFATIHFCWGGAFLVNIATRARWPRQPISTALPQVQSL